MHDITERERAEEALRESEERLRLASQAARVGTFIYDFQSGAGQWSPELKALLGVKADEPVPMDADGLVVGMHPDDRAASLAAVKAASDPGGNGLFQIDYRIILPDDSIRWLRVQGRIDFIGEGEDRRPSHSFGATADITNLKQAEEALRQAHDELELRVRERTAELEETNKALLDSEASYRELTESIDDPFYAMDRDLRYTYWNKASESLSGILAKDAIGKSIYELFPDVKGTKVEQFYIEALKTQQPERFESEYKLGDKKIVFEINTYPTKSLSEKPCRSESYPCTCEMKHC